MLDLDRLHAAYSSHPGLRRQGRTLALLWTVAHQAQSGNMKHVAIIAESFACFRWMLPMLGDALGELGVKVTKRRQHSWTLENGTDIIFVSRSSRWRERLAGFDSLIKFHDRQDSIVLWDDSP